MKRGFTLLELLIVIVIIAVLATLAFMQYGRMVERSRGAEAKTISGDIRKLAVSYRLQTGTLTGFTNVNANIGTDADQIPSACSGTHYFSYNTSVSDPTITITATRCTSGGKTPQGSAANTIILTSDLSASTDIWSGNGAY